MKKLLESKSLSLSPVCGVYYGPTSNVLQCERVVFFRIENELLYVSEKVGECGVLDIVHLGMGMVRRGVRMVK